MSPGHIILADTISSDTGIRKPDLYLHKIPYNRNIRRREMLANRLNFPIGENLNWRNSMVGSRNFMDATIDTHEWAREARHALELKLKISIFS